MEAPNFWANPDKYQLKDFQRIESLGDNVENATGNAALEIYFLKFRYNGHMTSYQFQVYNIMI